MAQTVQAIYEQGHLRLLEPVSLEEGRRITISIITERDRIPGDESDEEALMAELAAAFEGQPPLSETIIEERRGGR